MVVFQRSSLLWALAELDVRDRTLLVQKILDPGLGQGKRRSNLANALVLMCVQVIYIVCFPEVLQCESVLRSLGRLQNLTQWQDMAAADISSFKHQEGGERICAQKGQMGAVTMNMSKEQQ